MSRLKVVRVYKSLKSGGGVHSRLLELLPRLAEHAELRVLCYRGRGDRAAELEALGIPVDVLPTGLKWAPWNVGKYVQYFRQHRPDIVHTHEYTANTLAITAAAGAGVGIRIRHLHTMEPWGEVNGWRRRSRIRADIRAAKRAQITLAVSGAVRKRYLEDTGLSGDSCQVLYNGIDLQRFENCHGWRSALRAELGVGEGTPLIGMVGRLSPGKGALEFLHASQRIAQEVPGARFLLVGDGVLRSELEEQAVTLGIADRVLFTGVRRDVPAVLAALDVVLFPSFSEGLPGVVLEAMAAGRAVVAFDLPVMSEMVENGVTGERVAVGDVTGLARRTVELLTHDDERNAMGERARDRVQWFSLDRCVHQTMALYQSLSSPSR